MPPRTCSQDLLLWCGARTVILDVLSNFRTTTLLRANGTSPHLFWKALRREGDSTRSLTLSLLSAPLVRRHPLPLLRPLLRLTFPL